MFFLSLFFESLISSQLHCYAYYCKTVTPCFLAEINLISQTDHCYVYQYKADTPCFVTEINLISQTDRKVNGLSDVRNMIFTQVIVKFCFRIHKSDVGNLVNLVLHFTNSFGVDIQLISRHNVKLKSTNTERVRFVLLDELAKMNWNQSNIRNFTNSVQEGQLPTLFL